MRCTISRCIERSAPLPVEKKALELAVVFHPDHNVTGADVAMHDARALVGLNERFESTTSQSPCRVTPCEKLTLKRIADLSSSDFCRGESTQLDANLLHEQLVVTVPTQVLLNVVVSPPFVNDKLSDGPMQAPRQQGRSSNVAMSKNAGNMRYAGDVKLAVDIALLLHCLGLPSSIANPFIHAPRAFVPCECFALRDKHHPSARPPAYEMAVVESWDDRSVAY
jgi:hypothetical protein